jgi:hypothetical protein
MEILHKEFDPALLFRHIFQNPLCRQKNFLYILWISKAKDQFSAVQYIF